MNIQEILTNHRLILTEAAVIETLRRTDGLALHPQLEHALLIYDDTGTKVLRELFSGYIDIARRANVPLILCSPTWRASRNRLRASGVGRDVNGDAVRFLKDLRKEQGDFASQILIGGLIGCKNDCYQPEACLPPDESYQFHGWQNERLCAQGVDFLMAATLPALPEAVGIARSMSESGVPYFISFVINRDGTILDGTGLPAAIETIDGAAARPPLGYMINCAYPSFLNTAALPPAVLNRLVGFQGNASSLDHDQLDHSTELQLDPIEDWGDRMIELNTRFGIKILGGCCGTGTDHLKYIVSHFSADQT